MSDYVIATASTCDLDVSWLNEHNVPFISYNYVIGEKQYEDDCSDKTKDFILEQMQNDIAVSTAAITTYAYIEFFKKLLDEGKDVIMLDMTGALSSSYNNSLIAREEIKDDYPERRLEIIPTSAVTLLLGAMVKEAVAAHEAGKTLDEVIALVNDRKAHNVGNFMVNDLTWLRRGGRLSNASAVVGSLLSIKPLIRVDEEGKLVSYDKVRGTHKAYKRLIEDAAKCINDETAKHEIIIMYSGDRSDAEKVKEMWQEAYPDLPEANIYRLGPVIMGHIGPGFVATIYYGEPLE